MHKTRHLGHYIPQTNRCVHMLCTLLLIIKCMAKG